MATLQQERELRDVAKLLTKKLRAFTAKTWGSF